MERRLFLNVIFLFFYFQCFSQNNKLFIYEVKIKPEQNNDSLITKYMFLEPINGKSYFRTSDDKKEDSLNLSQVIESLEVA
jgi:hypothetical protein